MTPKPLPRHYSGPRSREFWKRVNALKGADHAAAYMAGVMLQRQEEVDLRHLEACEQRAKQRSKR
jgi:hypothetical protein